MIRWLLHRVGGRNLLSMLLLWVALSISALGVSKYVHFLNLTLFIVLAFVGLIIGWLLAIFPLKGWLAALLTLLLGITGSIYHFAQLGSPIQALLNANKYVISELLPWQWKGTPDITSILLASQQLNSQLGTFFLRVVRWGETLGSGKAGYDGLVISMLWALAFWFIVVWSGWAVFRRHQALLAILPAVVMLAGTLNYVGGNALYLAPLVGISLVLLAVTHYDVQERYWDANNIDFAEDIRLDMSTAIILITMVFMVTSALAPSFSVQQIIRVSQKITRFYQGRADSIAESLGLVPQSQKWNPFDNISSPGLPQSHLLGSGPELSKKVVMVITTGDYPPVPSSETLPGPLFHYYWRSVTYDIYTGRGWITSPIENTQYRANQPAIEGIIPITGTLRMVHQTVQLTEDLGGMLYETGQLVSVDKNYQVAWRLLPEQLDAGNSTQNQVADEFGSMFDGTSYTAVSFINDLSVSQLQAAAGEIPDWIEKRYLPLPDNIPERVRRLARDLTYNQITPYDQAYAIESYLRTYTYTLNVPFPPIGHDVADYFLFDLKRGYCDYYATAMVVLSRIAGLPARLVTGYASGTYDTVNARYVVTEANAHSWVEVYLAGIGWVEFEPTGGLPAIQRLSDQTGIVEIPQFQPVQHFSLLLWFMSIDVSWLSVLGGLAGILVLGIILWVSRDLWRMRQRSPSLAIRHLYYKLYLQGMPLVDPFNIGDTPYEYSSRLQSRLIKISIHPRWEGYFQRGVEESAHLTHLYTGVVYSPYVPDLYDKKTAIQTWRRLRWRLFWAGKIITLQRKLSKIKPVR
jgi:transglutaminase-like putative cysteine protease